MAATLNAGARRPAANGRNSIAACGPRQRGRSDFRGSLADCCVNAIGIGRVFSSSCSVQRAICREFEVTLSGRERRASTRPRRRWPTGSEERADQCHQGDRCDVRRHEWLEAMTIPEAALDVAIRGPRSLGAALPDH